MLTRSSVAGHVGFSHYLAVMNKLLWDFPSGSDDKRICLAMQETWVWEDPLGKGMATHSSTFAWEIPWTEEPGRLQSMGSLGVGQD